MNVRMSRPQNPGQEVDGRESPESNFDAPIGLPGEGAPEIMLADDEGREEKKHGAPHVFKEVMANLRAAFARKAAKQEGPAATIEGLEVEPSKTVEYGMVERRSEESERSDGATVIDGEVKAGAQKKIDQRVLLGGVAVAAFAVVAAGVSFWPSSPKKPVVAEQGMVAQQPLLAPAATLASVPKPEIKPTPELPSRSADPLKEILALKPQDEPAAAKEASAKPADDKAAPTPKVAPAKAVAENANPGAAVAAPDGASAKPVVEETLPRSVAEAGMLGGKPGEQADAGLKVAAVKEAAPNPQDRLGAVRKETALLDRVTQLAALVAHLSEQVNRIERVQKEESLATQERVADLMRRIAIAESGHQLDAAAKAQDPRNVQLAALANPPGSRGAPSTVVIRTGPSVASVESAGEKRPYRVQAASPSLAMLGTGGNDAPLEVTPGATVPGWGRVSKIEQRGQTWVVVTTGGVIQ